jgi:K(+)-stimulated pyrophosphate-energized sodium pump
MIEAVGAFNRRILSAVFQIVLYSSLTLYAFTFYFGKPFLWGQWIAFVIGGLIFVLGSFLTIMTVASYLPKIILADGKSRLLKVFNQGAILAFTLLGLIILGLVFCVFVLGTDTIIGFSLGTVLTGFFLRLGGSLYKSSADISSDVLAQSERNIPAFDARNPITLLDIIGDVVGKITGFGSDILMSFIFAVASCILFSFTLFRLAIISNTEAYYLAIVPFFIVGVGLISSVVAYGFAWIRIKVGKTQNVLLEYVYVAALCCGVGAWVVLNQFQLNIPMKLIWGVNGMFYPFAAYLIGLIGAIFLGFSSEYLTSYWYAPAKKLSATLELGSALTILKGWSLGAKSQLWFLTGIVGILFASFYVCGFYGIAMAALGMLSVTGAILTITFFSPLAANLLKISKLCNADEQDIKVMSNLDKLGHTTAALGNGFAVGAAVLSTFSLFFCISLVGKMGLSDMFLFDSSLLLGCLLGVSLPVIFSGFLASGLISTVQVSIVEVKRQFAEIPFLKEGKAKPDMHKASDAKSRAAMDALIIPGIIMVFFPIAVGFIGGIKVLAGLALGTMLMGFAQGFCFANGGGILHSAKQYLEKGYYGGKESPNYGYAVVADNIGDAWKDLLSPSMTIFMRCVIIIVVHLILLLSL